MKFIILIIIAQLFFACQFKKVNTYTFYFEMLPMEKEYFLRPTEYYFNDKKENFKLLKFDYNGGEEQLSMFYNTIFSNKYWDTCFFKTIHSNGKLDLSYLFEYKSSFTQLNDDYLVKRTEKMSPLEIKMSFGDIKIDFNKSKINDEFLVKTKRKDTLIYSFKGMLKTKTDFFSKNKKNDTITSVIIKNWKISLISFLNGSKIKILY
jgi:hypothetical protein